MPEHVLSFPFRIATSGTAAKVEHGSDAEIEQLIAIAALTTPGERITVPTFGVNDPVFAGFDVAALQRHCIDFGPDVTIISSRRTARSDDREELTVQWERRGEDSTR